MYKNYAALIAFFLMVNIKIVAMELQDILFTAVYLGIPEPLELFLTPDRIAITNDTGINLALAAIGSVYKHKKFDEFRSILKILVKNNFNLNEPMGNSPMSAIKYAAHSALFNKELRPVEIVCQEGASPFFKENEKMNACEEMVALCMQKKCAFAKKVVQVLGRYATTVEEASQAVSPAAIEKFITQRDKSNPYQLNGCLLRVINSSHSADCSSLYNALSLLIANGAHPNDAVTPLSYYTFMHLATDHAIATQDSRIIKALLSYGGSPFAGTCLDKEAVSPLKLAWMEKKKGEPFADEVYQVYRKHLLQK